MTRNGSICRQAENKYTYFAAARRHVAPNCSEGTCGGESSLRVRAAAAQLFGGRASNGRNRRRQQRRTRNSAHEFALSLAQSFAAAADEPVSWAPARLARRRRSVAPLQVAQVMQFSQSGAVLRRVALAAQRLQLPSRARVRRATTRAKLGPTLGQHLIRGSNFQIGCD